MPLHFILKILDQKRRGKLFLKIKIKKGTVKVRLYQNEGAIPIWTSRPTLLEIITVFDI